MKLVRAEAPARAGLVGHPSDGYGGRTLAVAIPSFSASAVIYEWDSLEVLPAAGDRCHFDSLDAFLVDVQTNGYDGGLRLVKATVKRFAEYQRARGHQLIDTFSLRYESDIPRQVGLAGSSAIVAASLKALCEFHGVPIAETELPSLALSIETDELGLAAGLQDRVAQVYRGLVYMDFDARHMACHGHGRYERLDPALLPPLFLAYRRDAAQSSDVSHGDLLQRYRRGDTAVRGAMERLADLAAAARDALQAGNQGEFAALLDAGFDVRRELYELDPRHVAMVTLARSLGCSATYTGSGGAIIGTYRDAATLESLREALARTGCVLIQPQLT